MSRDLHEDIRREMEWLEQLDGLVDILPRELDWYFSVDLLVARIPDDPDRIEDAVKALREAGFVLHNKIDVVDVAKHWALEFRHPTKGPAAENQRHSLYGRVVVRLSVNSEIKGSTRTKKEVRPGIYQPVLEGLEYLFDAEERVAP